MAVSALHGQPAEPPWSISFTVPGHRPSTPRETMSRHPTPYIHVSSPEITQSPPPSSSRHLQPAAHAAREQCQHETHTHTYTNTHNGQNTRPSAANATQAKVLETGPPPNLQKEPKAAVRGPLQQKGGDSKPSHNKARLQAQAQQLQSNQTKHSS